MSCKRLSATEAKAPRKISAAQGCASMTGSATSPQASPMTVAWNKVTQAAATEEKAWGQRSHWDQTGVRASTPSINGCSSSTASVDQKQRATPPSAQAQATAMAWRQAKAQMILRSRSALERRTMRRDPTAPTRRRIGAARRAPRAEGAAPVRPPKRPPKRPSNEARRWAKCHNCHKFRKQGGRNAAAALPLASERPPGDDWETPQAKRTTSSMARKARLKHDTATDHNGATMPRACASLKTQAATKLQRMTRQSKARDGSWSSNLARSSRHRCATASRLLNSPPAACRLLSDRLNDLDRSEPAAKVGCDEASSLPPGETSASAICSSDHTAG
mmetsp:Transcript_109377/g.316162  ORF Transcript_109377/g.316162 Transcript_109377/m.316162 type:complete len:333 (+) Transcript_109377:494-1492(+)